MRVVAGIFVFVFLISVASAASLSLKGEYDQGETILISVAGKVLEPIDRANVTFKRGHVLVPLDFEVIKVGGDWHVWALAPLNEEIYSVTFSDIVVSQDGVPAIVDLQADFSVGENKTAYAVKPGAVDATDEVTFALISYLDEDQTITVDFPEEREYALEPGENTITLSLKHVSREERVILVGQYAVPALLRGDGVVHGGDDEVVVVRGISFLPRRIQRSVLIPEDRQISVTYPLVVSYEGDEDLDDLRWIYDEDIFEITDLPERLETGETYPLEVRLIGFAEGGFDEVIRLESGDFSKELEVVITFTELEEEADDLGGRGLFTCQQLEGSVCAAGETCSSEIASSLDGSCCLGSCGAAETKKGGSVWGWIIALLVGIVLLWLGIKYRRAGKGRDRLKERVAKVK